jgi:hypothetical protein
VNRRALHLLLAAAAIVGLAFAAYADREPAVVRDEWEAILQLLEAAP